MQFLFYVEVAKDDDVVVKLRWPFYMTRSDSEV